MKVTELVELSKLLREAYNKDEERALETDNALDKMHLLGKQSGNIEARDILFKFYESHKED